MPYRARASRSGILIAAALCAFATQVRAFALDVHQMTGSVTGVITDDAGAPVAEARVTVTTGNGSRIVATGPTGRFTVANVPAGPFRLTVVADGFAEQTATGSVAAGEVLSLRDMRLRLAVNPVSIDVVPSTVEIAEQQIKDEEQQRVFGVVPNFFVSFVPDPAPLNTRQKFELSWKARIDPMQFVFVAIVAGVQQARNDYSGFGDGASGYAKRYAAAYATSFTSTMITRALLPSLFRQDPRYFYKGTGPTRSRLVYAMSRTVIRKSDTGRWQPNYSGILGSVASGAISNFYYPPEERRGVQLTLRNTALGLAGGVVGNVMQEFLYARFTSHGRR
jgi:Carboxypeptidase regulatory-like domain